jgi:hypothetical protein
MFRRNFFGMLEDFFGMLNKIRGILKAVLVYCSGGTVYSVYIYIFFLNIALVVRDHSRV